MEIGREIRRLRESKGWSQAKLAGNAGMGISGISQIETGSRNPSAVTLSKIAEALGVEVADLFPKAQAPLPDFGRARRLSLALEAVFVVAQAWETSIADIDTRKLPGIVEAAVSLAELLSRGLDPNSPRVPDHEYLPALDALSLLKFTADQGIARMASEASFEEASNDLIKEYLHRLGAIWEVQHEKLEAVLEGDAPPGLPHGVGAVCVTEEDLSEVRGRMEAQERRLRARAANAEAPADE
jgi:transcriptional regulator with XRE-family HTH domain